MKLERKFAPLEADIDSKGQVEGYASKFGIVDQGGDVVVKGAFTKSIATRRVKMLRGRGRPCGTDTSLLPSSGKKSTS